MASPSYIPLHLDSRKFDANKIEQMLRKGSQFVLLNNAVVLYDGRLKRFVYNHDNGRDMFDKFCDLTAFIAFEMSAYI